MSNEISSQNDLDQNDIANWILSGNIGNMDTKTVVNDNLIKINQAINYILKERGSSESVLIEGNSYVLYVLVIEQCVKSPSQIGNSSMFLCKIGKMGVGSSRKDDYKILREKLKLDYSFLTINIMKPITKKIDYLEKKLRKFVGEKILKKRRTSELLCELGKVKELKKNVESKLGLTEWVLSSENNLKILKENFLESGKILIDNFWNTNTWETIFKSKINPLSPFFIDKDMRCAGTDSICCIGKSNLICNYCGYKFCRRHIIFLSQCKHKMCGSCFLIKIKKEIRLTSWSIWCKKARHGEIHMHLEKSERKCGDCDINSIMVARCSCKSDRCYFCEDCFLKNYLCFYVHCEYHGKQKNKIIDVTKYEEIKIVLKKCLDDEFLSRV